MSNNIEPMEEITENQKKAVLEVHLVKVLEAIHEHPDVDKIPQYLREYFVNYCCENNCKIDETLEIVNECIKKVFRMKREEIIPESKRGKEFLIRMTLVPNLIKSGAIYDEKQTQEMMDTFCEVTGIENAMVAPIIFTEVKQQKRKVIEKDLYSFIEKHILTIDDPKTRKLASEEAITAFAKELKVEPKYVKGVLRDKKKKDEAEKKRIEEFRKSKMSENRDATNLDDGDPR